MSRPDFSLTWASSRLSIPAISGPDYALGFANYLGSQPPTTDDHDYIMNLQDRRAVWLGGQMLLAVGHEWQSNVTYNAFAVVRSPVNGQLYRSLVGSNLNNEPSVSGAQWALGVAQSADLLNTTRIDVASAGTVNLTTSAPSTRNINITGTATINGFTVAAGQLYFVRFNAALTLTNGAGLVTQTGANIVTAAGDTCLIRATAANVVEVLCYTRAIRQALGDGQTWQDLTASRALSTTYTNSTGRSICVSINTTRSTAGALTVTVSGLQLVSLQASGQSVVDACDYTFIVPAGATYSATGNAIASWVELR
jgi:hypothetical protein